jgi:hypothetical protein
VSDAYEATFPYRLAFAVAFFAVLGLIDYLRHPQDPRRAKEYLFLAFAMLAAVAYGIAHDHVTATISRPYFLKGKGLVDDPRPYRLAVTILAVKATYWVGLLVGVALLFANNASAQRAQLPYRDLCRVAVLVLATAALTAILLGTAFGVAAALDVPSMRQVTNEFVRPEGAVRFAIVWGAHMGSYAGGAVGAIGAVIHVRRRRRALLNATTCHSVVQLERSHRDP